MAHKLETKAGKAMYKLPGKIVVAEFGQIRDLPAIWLFPLHPTARSEFGYIFLLQLAEIVSSNFGKNEFCSRLINDSTSTL